MGKQENAVSLPMRFKEFKDEVRKMRPAKVPDHVYSFTMNAGQQGC